MVDNMIMDKGWRSVKLGEILKVCHGKNQKEIELKYGKYSILGTGGKIGETDSFLYDKPSVLIGRKGTIDSPQYINKPFWTIDTLFYTEINKEIFAKYIYYVFQMINWYSHNEASGVPSLSAKIIESINVNIPKAYSEQKAIATALSDMDDLILSIEKLISKKKLIKEGTMEELLTGKKRLEGFNDKWERKRFNEVCWFQEGPGLRNWQFTNTGMKVINVTNLEFGYLNLSKTDRYISLEEFHRMYKHFEIDDHDIVMASSGNSYGKVAVVRKQDLPLLMNTSVIRFKPMNKLNYNFLLQFLKSKLFIGQIDLLITGGAQPNFGPAHLNKIEINLPAKVEEQRLIGNILSDMDNEIEKLQKKLDKYKNIKSGMMEELLTGKRRLV